MIKQTLCLASVIKLLLLLVVLPALLAMVIGYWPAERYLSVKSAPVQSMPAQLNKSQPL